MKDDDSLQIFGQLLSSKHIISKICQKDFLHQADASFSQHFCLKKNT